ncbi:alpha/beta hydrolase [Paenibacillus doosanensis]|uniref:alpha/beta hydrolase n=1 Tax=Paenibacillus doosanensis TaxID=1229154 RepID=UPI002180405B|nr:alpha/beta hydrolase [Paenibacillus doosanensis]MCS7460404.1 alpha/beta hydrolase [Paenibacillus doosanensis]
MAVTKKSVTFNARGLQVAGILNIPDKAEAQKNPAIVCVHPGSSCKDQTAGIYAEKLAELGYVTIAFDASYQGESGGEPRYIEEPAARVEDVRCAVDYLTTLDYVDDHRIGVLGVCAGGGYAVNAAMTDRRIKAVGTVVGANIGRVNRESGDPIQALEAIAAQRTAEARGAETLITNWIPGNQEEREKAGLTDIDLVEAVDYYTTPRGQHPNSPNKVNFTSLAAVYGFDAFHLAEQLLTQPLQIIVGSVQGAFGSYKDGHELYQRAASAKKDLFVLEGASHYDLYDRPEPVRQAVEKLGAFYKENL